MNRLYAVAAAVLLTVSMTGCEEGEAVDIPGGGDGPTRELTLELITPTPLTAGVAFVVRATLTEDGSPASGVPVSFSAVNGVQQQKFVTPSTVNTALLSGTADTTVNNEATDRSVIVTATAANAADATLTVSLQAP